MKRGAEGGGGSPEGAAGGGSHRARGAQARPWGLGSPLQVTGARPDQRVLLRDQTGGCWYR